MDFLKAIFFGILEALTEFIPVSSTGHLIIVEKYISFSKESQVSPELFSIVIQLGAILAALLVFKDNFLSLLNFEGKNKISKDNFKGINGLLKLFFATLPLYFIGFLFYDKIKVLLSSTISIACALITGGILMILVEKIKKEKKEIDVSKISFKNSFLIGVFQCLSLWAGFSRSGSTIIGGMFLGLDRKTSAKFSFIIAVPAIFGAVLYEIVKSYSLINNQNLLYMIVGFIVSFITSIFIIKLFLKLLERISLNIFGIYRIILGIFIIFLTISHVI